MLNLFDQPEKRMDAKYWLGGFTRRKGINIQANVSTKVFVNEHKTHAGIVDDTNKKTLNEWEPLFGRKPRNTCYFKHTLNGNILFLFKWLRLRPFYICHCSYRFWLRPLCFDLLKPKPSHSRGNKRVFYVSLNWTFFRLTTQKFHMYVVSIIILRFEPRSVTT